jgi:hypothetical protein
MKSSTFTSRAAWRNWSSVISLVAEADVLGHRAGEQERILQHHREVLAQRGQILIAQVHAVQQNLARRHVVEAHHQAGQRGLARARVAHNGHRLSRLNGEAHVLQNPLDAIPLKAAASASPRV